MTPCSQTVGGSYWQSRLGREKNPPLLPFKGQSQPGSNSKVFRENGDFLDYPQKFRTVLKGGGILIIRLDPVYMDQWLEKKCIFSVPKSINCCVNNRYC